MAPRSHSLRLSTGIDCHVVEWGAEDPSLTHSVFLVHGFLDFAWSWEQTVELGLASQFHVVAPDMRGHGDSSRVGSGGYYHFLDYVADMQDIVRQLGRERVSLVGHSMGGSICSYYAGAYPERVSRLALLEGTGPPEEPDELPDRVRAWCDSWERAASRAPRSYATVHDAATQLRRNDPLLSEELAEVLATRGTRALADGRVQFKHDPLHLTRGPHPFRLEFALQFWRRIACPVLLVTGSESRLRLPPQELKRRTVAFATLESIELEGAGHMMQRHRPQQLATALGRFLAASD